MDNENTLPTPPTIPTPPVPGAAKAAAPDYQNTPPAPAPKAKAKPDHSELDKIFRQYTNLKHAWYDAKTGDYHFDEAAAEKAGASDCIESKHYKAPKTPAKKKK